MDFMILAPIMKIENFSHYNSALLRVKNISENSPENITLFTMFGKIILSIRLFFNSVNTVTVSLQ